MEELKEIIRSVCIISAGICIISGLTDGTRLKGQMKFLLNLIFILVISTPLLKGTLSIELPDISGYEEVDCSSAENIYNEELKSQTEKNISAVLRQQIEAAGIQCNEIETNINISETNSIYISNVTVSADNYEAAAQIIKNSLGQETEVTNGGT